MLYQIIRILFCKTRGEFCEELDFQVFAVVFISFGLRKQRNKLGLNYGINQVMEIVEAQKLDYP